MGVNNVDSDFVLSNNDLKKQLLDTMSGKQNVCVAQTSDNTVVIKLLEAMRSDINSLKMEVSNLKKKDRNEKGEQNEIWNQGGGE